MTIRTKYTYIIYGCTLLLITGLFFHLEDPFKNNLLKLFYSTCGLTLATVTYLWSKKDIMIIGLVLYLIYYNIKILFYPILPINDVSILTVTLELVGSGILLTSILFLIIGYSSNFDIKFLPTKFKLDLKPTLLIFLLYTGLFQFIMRSIW